MSIKSKLKSGVVGVLSDSDKGSVGPNGEMFEQNLQKRLHADKVIGGYRPGAINEND